MKNPTDATDAVVLTNALEKLRRRYRRVTVVANAGIALIVAASAALPLFVQAPMATAVPLTLLLTCAAFAIALGAAMIGTPARRQIAAIVDARLALDERLVTALQYVDDQDAVSRLVVRDAAGRVAAVAPARVFPYHVPARLPMVAAVALAASACLTLIAARVPVMMPVGTARAGATMPPGGTGPLARPRTQATTVSDSTLPTAAKPVAEASHDAGTRAAEAPTAAQSARAGAAGVRASAETAARAVPDAQRDPPRDSAPLAAVAPPRAAAGVPQRASSPSPNSHPGSAAGAIARAGSLSSAAGGLSGKGRGQRGGSGGVPQPDETKPDRQSQDYGVRYRESLARAESALAQEHTPPGLRAYVREYFLSIRPR
jgi:hypothetical protein